MTKLRKQRRRKVYRHNINRKRLRNKTFSVGNVPWYIEIRVIYLKFFLNVFSILVNR